MVSGVGWLAFDRSLPSSSFDFKDPDAWPRWKRRFKQIRLAAGLSTEGDEKQVSTLLYCMGEDAEDMLGSNTRTQWLAIAGA